MVDAKEIRVMQWKRGETPGPWRLFLFPTYRCNLECGYCAQALVDDPPELLKELSDERLAHLIDEAAELGVKELLIGGGGEPMLRRKAVMEMALRARKHDMICTLQTNATAFRAQDLETLVNIGWNFLSVSVDGPNAEVNDESRYKGSFDKLKKNLLTIKALKEKHRAHTPHVQLAVVVTAKNAHLLPAMMEFGREMGVQRLHYLDLYTRHEGLDAYLVSPECRKRIQQGAADAAALARKYGIDTNAGDFVNEQPEGEPWTFPQPRDKGDDNIAHITESTCFEPWLSLSIQSSGNTGPCCTFWEGHSTSIKDLSLREVWMGPYMTAMRQQMLTHRPPEPCRECHTDLIMHNRQVGAKVAALQAEHLSGSRGTAHLASKALKSLQKNGVRGSLQRGKEWLALRRSLVHK